MENVLKLTEPMMHGSAVKRLQEALKISPMDGIFGSGTEHKVKIYQKEHSLKVDGIVGPRTWKRILQTLNRGTLPAPPTHNVVDISDLHPKPRGFANYRARSVVDSITWHQTGCEMPCNPVGWGRVNAHYGVTQEGRAIALNAINCKIWHAQGLSMNSIGVEVEGNYPGVMDRPGTLWRGGGGPHELNQGMIEACNQVVVDILRKGYDLKYFFVHRQSSDTRRADPGEEIFKRVIIPLATKYDIKIDPTFTRGSGMPIPKEWLPSAGGKY